MVNPIAQISCWVVGDSTEGCKHPEGFYVNKSLDGKASRHNSELFMDIPLFPGRSIAIGRDHHENDISINHPYVSRRHFVIYSVVYDLEDIQTQSPLIYVRDRKSLEGTYVDDVCIGNREKGSSSGFYLSRDVVVTIKPHWKFRVSLLDHSDLKSPWTAIQLKESSLFNNRYIISNRILGSGAFASVHLAVDAKTGKQLACKVHDLDRLRRSPHSGDQIRRIVDETDILGKLRHPNLPIFVYAIRSRHTLYTFTELATGGDLFSMRLVQGVFTEQDSKLVLLQIVNAIKYLHEGGIAHRDLKPENVLFATGPHVTGRVIVGDLGFARSAASGRMASRVGTNHEVECGLNHDLSIDIWSLGMIAIFLLAPDHHAAPSNLVKVSQAAINAWLYSVFGDPSHQKISDNCKSFIKSCLMFEPKRRIGASEAKQHPWFRQDPGKRQCRFRLEENTKIWKPVHVIAPPVQQLPDLGNVANTTQLRKQDDASCISSSPTVLNKRKLIDTALGTNSSQESPYFGGPWPVTAKRSKTSEMNKEDIREANLIFASSNEQSVATSSSLDIAWSFPVGMNSDQPVSC
ncbi:kinase-like protein [Jackrogersella minutella]|nr:kinase-like protein [Jackrogersella minutella]